MVLILGLYIGDKKKAVTTPPFYQETLQQHTLWINDVIKTKIPNLVS